MAWTMDQVFESKTLVNPMQVIGEYQFHVGKLETEITVRLLRPLRGEGIWWEQSHFIKTPTQLDVYMPGRPWGDYAEYALHLACTSITQYYDEAIKAGHDPVESWLVPNKTFA